MEFGCNTPCVEVRDDGIGAYLILDAGTGLVGLSEALAGEPHVAPILLSHYHWDHTQGLPFFGPLYAPGWHPEVFAPDFSDVDDGWLASMFDVPNFPVPFESLPNRPRLHRISAASRSLGGFRVDVQPLSHPGGAFAYRIHGRSGDLCYVTDHEFGEERIDRELTAFCRGCAALISDAHFTPDELVRHAGWGHGSWRRVAEFAAACDAGQLWLFHHKPGRTDVELRQIVDEARRIFPASHGAREGLAFHI